MKVLQLTKDTNYEIYQQISLLHKSSLTKTIATTLTTNRLSRLYIFLIKNNLLKVIYIQIGETVAGCASYSQKNKNYTFKQLFELCLISLTGLILHPLVWIIESYFKKGLYKDLKFESKLVTLFVNKELQNKSIASGLVSYIKENEPLPIVVDTRNINHSALNFYNKNGFHTVNKNKRNTVLLFQNT
jgi:GNAT superfamily N-acetyltransferase